MAAYCLFSPASTNSVVSSLKNVLYKLSAAELESQLVTSASVTKMHIYVTFGTPVPMKNQEWLAQLQTSYQKQVIIILNAFEITSRPQLPAHLLSAQPQLTTYYN